MVPLIPSKADLTISSATPPKTLSCSDCSENTLSNAKFRNGDDPVPSKFVTLIERSSVCSIHMLVP
jgi:hypothetical protein